MSIYPYIGANHVHESRTIYKSHKLCMRVTNYAMYLAEKVFVHILANFVKSSIQVTNYMHQ